MSTAVKEKITLRMERIIAATPERLFALWTEPEELIKWWGPEGYTTPQHAMDVRPGGRYRISFKTEDGEYHEVGGVYREVAANSRLVFSWAWHSTPERESLVTVTVAKDGDGTMLTLHHEQFVDDKARDGHRRGWTGTLDKLERYVSQA